VVKELGEIAPHVEPTVRQRGGRRTAKWVAAAICAALLIGAAIPIALVMLDGPPSDATQRIPYLGVYERSMPSTYAGVGAFTRSTGARPDLVMFYSSWLEPFPASFARTAASHGAVPLVQINPYGVSLPAIVSGQYDAYLSSYAQAVRAYRGPVILSFGHEMNGHWYPWGYTRTSPAVFVSAWRHIVDLFRGMGVRNVTWLWTVNIIDTDGGIPPPGAWWPGASYVTWIGIDGYYHSPSLTFSSLFGPTIAAVREISGAPILIAETAAPSGADQPAKIADLFAGIRLYGLLGFVWFEVADRQDWLINTPGAIAALRRGAQAYYRPRS
jgi:mannan endo-1,4-beta-mannosidase